MRRGIERAADRGTIRCLRLDVHHPAEQVVGVVFLGLRRFVRPWEGLVDNRTLEWSVIQFVTVPCDHHAGHDPLAGKIDLHVAEITVGAIALGVAVKMGRVVRPPGDRPVSDGRQDCRGPGYDAARARL